MACLHNQSYRVISESLDSCEIFPAKSCRNQREENYTVNQPFKIADVLSTFNVREKVDELVENS